MSQKILFLVLFALSFTNAKADEPNYEFKGNTLYIHTKPQGNLPRGKINTNIANDITIPAGSEIKAVLINDAVFEGNVPQVIFKTEEDFIFQNKIVIPKGSTVAGSADLERNQRVEFDLAQLNLPEGKKYYIDAEARQLNGKDYIKAQYVHQTSGGKKIASRTFGSVAKGALGRALGGGTVAEDAAYGAGDAATDEAQDVIESNSKTSYSKVSKDTKVKIIFLKSL